MKPVLIKWKDTDGATLYSVGFYVRETKRDLFFATEYCAGEYRDIISIPIKAIEKRQPLVKRIRHVKG